MAKYSFKSVGTIHDHEKFKEEVEKVTLPPIGIKTPLELSNDGRSSLFNMNFELRDQIHDNLRNLLLTNRGERLGRPDFGTGLRELTFEMINSPGYEQIVMTEIKTTVGKYMPFVSLQTFGIEKVDIHSKGVPAGMSKLEITVEYRVENLSSVNKALEIVLYIGG